MKFQVTILLLASLAAYANGAFTSGSSVSQLVAKKSDGSAMDAAGVTTGDIIKFVCKSVDDGSKGFKLHRVGTTAELHASTALGTAAAANKEYTYDYTTVAADESAAGGTTSYTCTVNDGTNDGAVSTPATTVKVSAPTTTAAPTTTTAGGSGGKNGAGSNSPVMAVFLLTIAAMCF